MTCVNTTRRPGRPPKAEAGDTKAALVDAALRLFARHGYAGTSIRAIAREVGLSESVLYAHFDGKKAIYEAAMSLAGPQVALVALDDAPDGPAAFVRSFGERVLAAWDTPQARQSVSLVSRDGLIHDEMLGLGIERALAGLAEVFARWLADGRVRADLGAAEDLAYALLGPIAHARVMWLHEEATREQRELGRGRIERHTALFAAMIEG
ncbi:TetR/AcrR family transcriptional regulator [Nonomuraea rhizosphaerae]|uniref:TetR/AcrR family transcriptional regulator n=1 Tax=Nonomuraea rhizosphaerae TaxID=2665663 RepID=UPI001C5E1CF0|nr:TetR/AcrR family transcriptional regulator [Nonomuraea rhizosphaerae]